MAKRKASVEEMRRPRPALTPEAREKQLIALAYDLVEQRILNGTASSQETTHFLKLGSMKAQLERDKLVEENKLLRAKTEQLQSESRSEEFYREVIASMKKYKGQNDD